MSKEIKWYSIESKAITPEDYSAALRNSMRRLSKDKFEEIMFALAECDINIRFHKEAFSFIALLTAAQLNEAAEQERHYEMEWVELFAQCWSRVQNYVRS